MPERWIYRISRKNKSRRGERLVFTCQQCGECCSSMGEIIEIQEELDHFFFRIRFTVTGEERIVSIDPEKQELFSSGDGKNLLHGACPFLRPAGNKRYLCSVHASRPDLCCQYSCYRILVLDPRGKRIGRVMDNTRYVTTADVGLRMLWNREIAHAAIPDETCWEEYVEQILSPAGYRVVR